MYSRMDLIKFKDVLLWQIIQLRSFPRLSVFHKSYLVYSRMHWSKWLCYDLLGLCNFLARIYLFKFNKRNIRTACKISLIIKTSERRQWRCSCLFIVTFEQILRIVLVFPLLKLNTSMPAESLVVLFFISGLNSLSRTKLSLSHNFFVYFFTLQW